VSRSPRCRAPGIYARTTRHARCVFYVYGVSRCTPDVPDVPDPFPKRVTFNFPRSNYRLPSINGGLAPTFTTCGKTHFTSIRSQIKGELSDNVELRDQRSSVYRCIYIYTLPFKRLGSLRNFLIFERKALFFSMKITLN